MAKLRKWYVATVVSKLVEVGPQSYDSQTVKTRVGAVDAIDRATATAQAQAQWPGKSLEITRGSQG